MNQKIPGSILTSGQTGKTLVENLAVMVGYYLLGRLGLSLLVGGKPPALIWPPSGFAMVILMLRGYRVWPGIFVGIVLVNLRSHLGILLSSSIAAGNTLEGVAAAWLVRRFADGIRVFDRPGTILRFILLAGFLSAAISATCGAVSLALGKLVGWDRFATTWLSWWLANTTSMLLIGPVLLVWLTNPLPHWKPAKVLEGSGLGLLIFLIGTTVFLGITPIPMTEQLEYLAIIPITWAAFRFGARGVATSAVLILSFALWGTMHQHGPFVSPNPAVSVLALQTFVAVLSTGALLFMAANTRRAADTRKLGEAEELWRFALEGAHEGVYDWNIGTDQLKLSKRYKEMLGYQEDELNDSFEQWLKLVHPEDLPWVMSQVEAITRGQASRFAGEYRMRCKDGGWKWVLSRGLVIHYDAAGKPRRMVGTHADVTERKQTELKLREGEEWNQVLLETTSEGYLRLDADGNFLDVNDAYCRMTGFSREELLGKQIYDISLRYPAERSFKRQLNEINKAGSIRFETRHRRKDGRIVELEAVVTVLKVKGTQYFNYVRDITERKLLERQLSEISANERQKFGHDLHDGLGQYLAGIAFKTKALEVDLSAAASPHAAEAGEIVRLVNDAIAQTRDLARLLAPVADEKQGLESALKNLAAQAERLFGISCAFRPGSQELELGATANQALYRIAQEAIHNAVSHGGAGRVEMVLDSEGNDLASLTISDDGQGFLPDAFINPGMGLRIMKHRAASIGGTLAIYSQKDGGMVVKCTTPIG